MLINRYMPSTKNLPKIMAQIVAGSAPKKFTVAHLKGLGFKSSNDLAVIPLLKDLKFLGPDGTPLQRYHDYRDPSRSKKVLGQALREAYEDLFQINENLSDKDREAIKGRFKATHNVETPIASHQGRTFLVLLALADTNSTGTKKAEDDEEILKSAEDVQTKLPIPPKAMGGLHYNIEIHLPASKDIEVFNAIFKSLREHLIG
jgi:hypothetical protein